MKEKFKSYSFWMSVTASIILVLNNLGNVLGFSVQSETVTKIVDSICGVLILFGIITMPKSKEETDNEKTLQQNEKETKDESQDKSTEKPEAVLTKVAKNTKETNEDNKK